MMNESGKEIFKPRSICINESEHRDKEYKIFKPKTQAF